MYYVWGGIVYVLLYIIKEYGLALWTKKNKYYIAYIADIAIAYKYYYYKVLPTIFILIIIYFKTKLLYNIC